MFRDKECTLESYTVKFTALKKKLDEMEEVRMDSQYLEQLSKYIEELYRQTVMNNTLDEAGFNELREPQMSNLNRLQKLKNSASYRKDKHKHKSKNEDWGE